MSYSEPDQRNITIPLFIVGGKYFLLNPYECEVTCRWQCRPSAQWRSSRAVMISHYFICPSKFLNLEMPRNSNLILIQLNGLYKNSETWIITKARSRGSLNSRLSRTCLKKIWIHFTFFKLDFQIYPSRAPESSRMSWLPRNLLCRT